MRGIEYLNPFSDYFNSSADFQYLNRQEKIITIAATVFACLLTTPFFFIGGFATLRLLIDKFSIKPIDLASLETQKQSKVLNEAITAKGGLLQRRFQRASEDHTGTLSFSQLCRSIKQSTLLANRQFPALFTKSIVWEAQGLTLLRQILFDQQDVPSHLFPEYWNHGKPYFDDYIKNTSIKPLSENIEECVDQFFSDAVRQETFELLIGGQKAQLHENTALFFTAIKEHYFSYLIHHPLKIPRIHQRNSVSEAFKTFPEGCVVKQNGVFYLTEQALKELCPVYDQVLFLTETEAENIPKNNTKEELEGLIRMKVLEAICLMNSTIYSCFAQGNKQLPAWLIASRGRKCCFEFSEDMNSVSASIDVKLTGSSGTPFVNFTRTINFRIH